MQVKGSNLLNASKVVFSLSREEINDNLFLKEDIISKYTCNKVPN